ncbi:DUF2630 family protein [Actinomadura parmotrematis]|uniref:DUF2630 family protein n=1 Tax=Actinomadura parmotrematis TaxID=2864039 RepID=A0ABS7FZ98_9ACTN|nr:DUF2630 family protein [Actinomadura parmotrematis]MBW8485767.1 DUF2630 family protein [Actinomadura parmotrematis]
MDDEQILSQISGYVTEEKDLRGKLQRGELSQAEEQERLKRIEVALDQCWDLLRQRRAREDAGENPGEAHVRPASEVEGYIQ